MNQTERPPVAGRKSAIDYSRRTVAIRCIVWSKKTDRSCDLRWPSQPSSRNERNGIGHLSIGMIQSPSQQLGETVIQD